MAAATNSSKMKSSDWIEVFLKRTDILRDRWQSRKMSGQKSMATRSKALTNFKETTICLALKMQDFISSLKPQRKGHQTLVELEQLVEHLLRNWLTLPRDWRRESLNARLFGIHWRTWRYQARASLIHQLCSKFFKRGHLIQKRIENWHWLNSEIICERRWWKNSWNNWTAR